MVDMDKKEQILHYHRIDGLSQREIARSVGVSRKTVKRYITEYEAHYYFMTVKQVVLPCKMALLQYLKVLSSIPKQLVLLF